MDFLTFYLLYCAFAICYVLWITARSRNRFFTPLIAFWVLAFPILNRSEFMIHTPWGFDLSPSRMFLIVGLVGLVIAGISHSRKHKKVVQNRRLTSYEFYLFAYILISSLIIILKAPGFREMMPLISGQIVFAVMYLVARDHLDGRDIRQIEKLLIVFGCLSVVTSIVQFIYAPDFFRISSERPAFGSFIRANGFMFDEYDNGLFLTCLVALVLTGYQRFSAKLALIAVFGIGVFLTMHRASWLIFCLSILFFFLFSLRAPVQRNTKNFLIIGYFLTVSLVLFALIYPNITSRRILDQDFIYDQLNRDTLRIRGDLARFGLYLTTQYPEGIGDFGFPSYAQSYHASGLPLNYGKPLIVHNGFVAAGNKYGVLGGILFILFLFFTITFTLRKYKEHTMISVRVLLICFAIIVINLTQDMSGLGAFPQIVIGYFLGTSRRFIQ